ncbi:MAG: glycosyltransferase family 4 protein [Bacteroidota bacterium]
MAKILFHSLTFAPDSVSTAYLLTDLTCQLQTLGHEVIVLTTTPHYNIDHHTLAFQPMKKRWFGLLYQSVLNGVHVWHIKLPMKGGRVFSRVFDYIYFHVMSLIVGFIFLGSYDIVITPSPPLTIGIVGWLLARRSKVPFIYNVQELYPDYAVNQGLIKNKLFIAILRWIEQFVYARSTKLVPISEGFSEIIQRRGISRNKINVISNFVDVDQYPVLPRANPFSLKNDLLESFVVYYGGNIGLSQDWNSLLHAAKNLSHLPIQYIITGDGVNRAWLENEVCIRNLQNVKVLGYQEKQIIPYIYACSDICTIPMKAMTTIDTFPSKVYSIMASRRAVLAQAEKGSELWWLINEAKCGWVILPGDPQSYADALLRAYNSRKELIEMGERGRRFVMERYSKIIVAKKYDTLIRELSE